MCKTTAKIRNTLAINTQIFPHGKTTAIVGASGSGKSTLLKLILGFYLPTKGCIQIDSTNLKEIDVNSWRKACGVVMQDGVIFSDSILNNITLTDEEIDYKRVIYASKVACIYDFIMNLPAKFKTIIGMEGTGLSQGQKQRILIARAVYRNPSYIFLDEATNSLDTKNERQIISNLKEFYKGRTVIVVAHRLSTVKDADNIIVLDKGKIVEQGNHNALIGTKGVYYNLIKNQLELDK